MGRNTTLSERFQVHVRRGDSGDLVRVVDTVTGLDRVQLGFEEDHPDDIACRLAAQILADSISTVTIARIFMVDIYRDGGSYGLCFYSPDNEWFEFHLKILPSDHSTIRYEMPKLYFHSVNDRIVVRNFTWEEAEQFVSCICPEHFALSEGHDPNRLVELVEIIRLRGRSAD